MTRRTQKSLTFNYPEKNEATNKVELYLENLEGGILKQDILGLLYAKYLPFFGEEISRELYQQELLKSLIFIRGILFTLEQELERARNLPVTRLPFYRSKSKPTTENTDLAENENNTSEEAVTEKPADSQESVALKNSFPGVTLN